MQKVWRDLFHDIESVWNNLVQIVNGTSDHGTSSIGINSKQHNHKMYHKIYKLILFDRPPPTASGIFEGRSNKNFSDSLKLL